MVVLLSKSFRTPTDLVFTNLHLNYPHNPVSYSRPDFKKETSGFFLTTFSLRADDTTLFLVTVCTCSLEISVCQNTLPLFLAH
jgi:hypothetical protein